MSYPADPAIASLLNELHLQRLEMEQRNRQISTIQRRLEESEERFADIYENAQICYFILNKEGVIHEVSASGALLLGMQSEQLIGEEFSRWVAKEDVDDFLAHLGRVFENGSKTSVELNMRCLNGHKCHVILESTIDEFDHDLCKSVLFEATNTYREHIYYLAHYDVLTALPNRVLFQDRFAQALASADRKGDMVALLFLDLDRFKSINDSLGHIVGDELLKSVARRLVRCTRKFDTVARLSGDEFVIILSSIANSDFISIVAENVLESIKAPFHIEGHVFSISASIGASVYPNDGDDMQTLLRNADSAMYHAKKLGRGNFQFYTDEMNARVLESLAIENNLKKALGTNGFEMYYQPQVEAGSGRIIGLEGMLYWHHPEFGLLEPDAFMQVAEDRGLILDILSLTLNKAADQLDEWRKTGLYTASVAIRMSATQIRRHGLIGAVSQLLRNAGMDPGLFEFEITERDLAHESDAALPISNELRKMEVKLSVANFGIGYCSLSSLRAFPVSKLKIGKSIVADLPGNPDSAAIADAIISLAKSLGLVVIAEGVESMDQWEFLKSRGCHGIQGRFFSAAVDAAGITTILRENRSVQQNQELR